MSYFALAMAIQGRLRLLEGVELVLDPNRPHEDIGNRPHVALKNLAVGETPVSGGLKTQTYRGDGVAELAVRWPKNVGMGNAWKMVDQIADVAVGALADTGACFGGCEAYIEETGGEKFFHIAMLLSFELQTTRARVPPQQYVEPDFVDDDYVDQSEVPS